jgi:hypothetical protein
MHTHTHTTESTTLVSAKRMILNGTGISVQAEQHVQVHVCSTSRALGAVASEVKALILGTSALAGWQPFDQSLRCFVSSELT